MAWKAFLNTFWLLKSECKSQLREVNGEFAQSVFLFFLFYVIVNYQFKTSELKNAEKFGGANSSSLKVLLEWTGNVHFCTICEITFLEIECGP